MSTASSADESDKSDAASAPKWWSQRIASQNSDLAVAASQLRLSSSLSSSYDLNNLASRFKVNTDTNSDTGTISDTDTNININEANEKEKNWWLSEDSLGFLDVDKKRRFLDYQNGTVIIIELPTGKHEVAYEELSGICTNLPTNEYEEMDGCFGNPWLTIIFEITSLETLQHVKGKINNHWLAPNHCEDVIVIKIGPPQPQGPFQPQGPLQRLGVAIDLYDIQQAIFQAMGPN
ncbi:hypothetical protein C1645_818689 [Glomus cerebriforme]|uniref:Uncharacterized protein n=1 Tax=Glomus cerebriforme TaxID=658196 RepID=A0A397TGM2_9GLOM|nr:hypothetical protein C1645_818689 [Glomus cerebriforme]